MDERREGEWVEDLDVARSDSEDVKGGALNAYVSQVKGEKQGKFEGAGFFKSVGGMKSEAE